MDGFEKPELSQIEEKYRNRVESEIISCPSCQPWDEGVPIWIYGERIELEYLLYDLKVPEKYWNKIIPSIHCRCGDGNFNQYSDVGVKTRFEKEVDKHMDEVYRLYGSEVQHFEELLEKYPLLAHSNKFAKRIHKELKARNLPIAKIRGQFYRARIVESSEVICKEKMYNPPIGKPQEGRFNHAGQSHLYLSNDRATAIREVVGDEPSLLVWCQGFNILEDVEKVLDLSFDWQRLTPSTSTLLLSLNLRNSIGRDDRNKDLWKPDYYLTRYIMDCAREQGYNGIKYNSTKDTSEYNVVLFYPEKLKISAIGEPSIQIFFNKEDKNEFQASMNDL